MSAVALYLLLLKATALSFSGFASVPMVREDLVVRRAVLTDQQLNDAIAISQASPGPLGLYVVILGYFVMGMSGAAVGVLALASPAVLAVPIARVVRTGRAAELRGACSGIVIASCALMIETSLRLAPEAVPGAWLVVLAATAFVILATTRIPPIAVIAASAIAGLLLP